MRSVAIAGTVLHKIPRRLGYQFRKLREKMLPIEVLGLLADALKLLQAAAFPVKRDSLQAACAKAFRVGFDCRASLATRSAETRQSDENNVREKQPALTENGEIGDRGLPVQGAMAERDVATFVPRCGGDGVLDNNALGGSSGPCAAGASDRGLATAKGPNDEEEQRRPPERGDTENCDPVLVFNVVRHFVDDFLAHDKMNQVLIGYAS